MSASKPGEGVSIIDRALSGDKDAFGMLAEEHREALLRLCFKMTGSHEEAEDLVQETLLKAYAKFGTFELRSSLGTWLYRIATNACLDHQRDAQAVGPRAALAVVPGERRAGEEPRTVAVPVAGEGRRK